MTLPRNLDDALEAQILELLADEKYQGHPCRLALQDLWEAMNSQLDRLERITELSDRYQKAARENTLHLAKRYDRQIRLLERVLRISDRYQSMLKDLNVALREASTHDLLTGIANRRLMMDCCRQADLQFAKQGIPYSMVVIDADHFKLINDTYGHDFGDRMLVELARVFRENLRSADVCSRWGGEEFLGLMNQASLTEAERIVERLLESVRSSRIPYEQEMVTLTVSMGVAEHEEGETYADTFRRADEALFVAKRRGRNCYVVAPPSGAASGSRHLSESQPAGPASSSSPPS
ncbi:biofilm regulation diguanylate cyclase SiaD [Synechococcus sp. CBW1004]|uniref:biofilm regulation diguanylate cyclase SiaD n=1 Tax=Synechococcus sp. CBW1004 TaxID=1353136 RepID=UPI0018CDB54B|nr:biofilm regulation diguanylate cyclase SiaD [Synechococcus sp. CBW1004]QPN63697.1 GGDEF domain-containing protein [Synechococcus sp. CBW1004]